MQKPFNYEVPNWEPLRRALDLAHLPASLIGSFMWMYEDGPGVHNYKHRATRAYVRLRMDTSAPACERDIKTALPAIHCDLCGTDRESVDYFMWSQKLTDAEFQAYEARCQYLAHKADGNLSRADVPQMIEDCMDDGGPLEGLSVR